MSCSTGARVAMGDGVCVCVCVCARARVVRVCVELIFFCCIFLLKTNKFVILFLKYYKNKKDSDAERQMGSTLV